MRGAINPSILGIMRRPLSSAALAFAVSALCLARGAAAKSGPSQELVDTACSSGVLLQRNDAGSTDAAPDDDAPGGAFAGGDGLFGSSGGGDDKAKKGDAKSAQAPEKKQPKPKTKLLRPRSDKDKAGCPDKFRGFYEKYGDKFSAVPAPGNLDAAQIEKNIDHVFDVTSGPAQKQLLKDIKGEDMAAKSAVVNKIFDGVKTLDAAAFGTTIASNLHDLSSLKAGEVLKGDFGEITQTPEKLAAAKTAEAANAALAAKLALDTPNDPLSQDRKKALQARTVPPEPSAIQPPAAPMVIPPDVVPQEPGWLRQKYNNLKAEVGDWANGSPIANYEGERTILPNPTPVITPPGSDQSVSVRLPQATGLSPHCEPGCYGTAKMISGLVGMGEDFSAYYKGQKTMSIGGISKQGGGYFPPHVSHQKGIDADITFQHGSGGFDVAANSMIVASVVRKLPDFMKFGHVNGRQYILVDQSKHAAIGYGLDQLAAQGNLTTDQAAMGKKLLVHWPNHNDHFHVRILP